LVRFAKFGVGVASALAVLNAPESINGQSSGVWAPVVASTFWFEAVALAVNVVEHVVLRADLGDASASAAVSIAVFSKVTWVPELVGSALLG